MLGKVAHGRCIGASYVVTAPRTDTSTGEDKAPVGVISAAAKRTQRDEGLVVTAAQVVAVAGQIQKCFSASRNIALVIVRSQDST